VTTNIRDPRSIVTPDAFSVSEEMLGLPLATPGRRLAGMLIDLAVIGLLTAFVTGWGFLIWGLIGLVMLQLALRSPGGSWTEGQLGRATVWVFRGSTGCLGVFILAIVLIAWWGSQFDDDEIEEGIRRTLSDAAPVVEQAVIENAGDLTDEQIEDLQALADLAAAVAPEDSVELDPDEGAESDEAAERSPSLDALLVETAWGLDRAGLASALTEVSAEEMPDSVSVAGATVPASVWADILQTRAVQVFASDTVEALERANGRSAEQMEELRVDLAEAREEADSGLFALARDILGQLGSAFGVWTLYFTVATVVLRGRTAGKLLTRTRVVRLDGKPLTWLLSLERAGGYAAGLATGLMGFMQVYWDRNRQCVHDRIAGTVVVREGIAAVPGSWEEVWTAEEEGP